MQQFKKYLLKWINHGELDDPMSEFFIRCHSEVSDLQSYWKEKYTIESSKKLLSPDSPQLQVAIALRLITYTTCMAYIPFRQTHPAWAFGRLELAKPTYLWGSRRLDAFRMAEKQVCQHSLEKIWKLCLPNENHSENVPSSTKISESRCGGMEVLDLVGRLLHRTATTWPR